MVYLPTFGWFLYIFVVNIRYMDPMGNFLHSIFCIEGKCIFYQLKDADPDPQVPARTLWLTLRPRGYMAAKKFMPFLAWRFVPEIVAASECLRPKAFKKPKTYENKKRRKTTFFFQPSPTLPWWNSRLALVLCMDSFVKDAVVLCSPFFQLHGSSEDSIGHLAVETLPRKLR